MQIFLPPALFSCMLSNHYFLFRFNLISAVGFLWIFFISFFFALAVLYSQTSIFNSTSRPFFLCWLLPIITSTQQHPSSVWNLDLILRLIGITGTKTISNPTVCVGFFFNQFIFLFSNRHHHGMREGVDERAFFPEASGTVRGLQDSYTPLKMNSSKGYSDFQYQKLADNPKK